jgi:hypothetical protein
LRRKRFVSNPGPNPLFSFEKMALRDAVGVPLGTQQFAEGLYGFLHGHGTSEERFGR